MAVVDPDIAELITRETERQQSKIQMIPSESLCPAPVLAALATPFSNKYAEGYPSTRMVIHERHRPTDIERLLAFHRRYSDRRFYKGTEFADFVEALAQKRCAELFANKRAAASDIFVNAQPLSGAAANNAVYEALVKPGDPVMGMHLSYGGHLTHGSPFNRSGKHYRVAAYVTGDDGKIDFDAFRRQALEHKPKLVIAGASAYPWTIEWTKIRKICDEIDAYLLADISHPAGLVAAGLFPNPVGVADVTMFTTHKTLCGPRGAMLLSTDPWIARRIDSAVFPGEQGGPHVNTMAAKAVAFRLALTKEFRDLQKRILENMQALVDEFRKLGLPLTSGGSNTHLCLLDLRKMSWPTGAPLTADIASNILDLCGITCNKNALAGDATGVRPSGLRFGSVIPSQRGFGPAEMRRTARLIDRTIRSIEPFRVQTPSGPLTRGKIPYETVREIRDEVAKLTKCPRPRPTSFEVRGERARVFLDQAATGDVLSLRAGSAKRFEFLRPDGRKIGSAVVARTRSLPDGQDRFELHDAPTELFDWLTALSDGYTRVDERDIRSKVHGPVAVAALPSRKVSRVTAAPVSASKPFFVGQNRMNTKTPSSASPAIFTYAPAEIPMRKTPLYEEHKKLGARLLPFGGYEMPGWYGAVAKEHDAVRKAAGLFDVAHMGTLEVSGDLATEFLDTVTTNFVHALEPGQSQYTYILDVDGNVLDDVIVYRLAADRYLVVVNASNQDKIWAWWNAVNDRKAVIDRDEPGRTAPGPVKLRRLKDKACGADRLVDLAFQGPASRKVLRRLMTEEDRAGLKKLHRFNHCSVKISNIPAIVSRTGYTGQDTGYEIFVHPDQAVALWTLLLETGKDLGVLPAGLGARDSTRAEAGFPLYGHELAGDFNMMPSEAGYGGFVKRHKPFFVGKKPLLAREEKQTHAVCRFKMKSTGIKVIRGGDPVLDAKGEKIGTVTSAVLVEKMQIGLAYVLKTHTAPETEFSIALLPRKGDPKFDPSLPRETAVVLPRFASFA